MSSRAESEQITPEISVIIPVYNTEKYLEACLQSVLNDDCPSFEIIIVNDDSPDNSQSIIEDYTGKHPSIVAIRQSHGRQGKARNTGLSKARGKYIFFLDSDDLLAPGALSYYHGLIERHDSDVVMGPAQSFKRWRRWINPGHRHYVKETYNIQLENIPELLADTSCCNKLYRKSFLDRKGMCFQENIFCEDVDFVYRLYLSGPKISFSSKIIHKYRGRSGNGPPSGTQIFSEKRLHDIFTVYGSVLTLYLEQSTPDVLARLERQVIDKLTQIFRRLPVFPEGRSDFYSVIQQVLAKIQPLQIARYGDYYSIPLVMIRQGYTTHASALLNYGMVSTVVEDFFHLVAENDQDFLKELLKIEFLSSVTTLDRVVSHGNKSNYMFVIKRNLGRIANDLRQLRIDTRQLFRIGIKTILGRYRIRYNSQLKEKIKKYFKTRSAGLVWRVGYVLFYKLAIHSGKPRTWLVGERGGKGSSESGFIFFSHCRLNLKTDHVYYILDKSVDVPEPLLSDQFIIRRGSAKHFRILLLAECFLFTNNELDVSYFIPSGRWCSGIKTVFLNHGVTYYNPGVYLRRIANRFDMIIAVGDREKKQKVSDWSLKDPSRVKVTGFPLFDPLQEQKTKNEILFCPTWRNQLDEKDNDDFCKSLYFEEITRLLQDQRLAKFLNQHDLVLTFRCHFRMAHHLNSLYTKVDSSICIDSDKGGRSLQQCLSDAKVLITDYSSILWDMAYMKKPVVLFQFDRLEFLAERGLHAFSTPEEEMVFAEICDNRDVLFTILEELARRDFTLRSEQLDNVTSFISYFDSESSKRLYGEVESLCG